MSIILKHKIQNGFFVLAVAILALGTTNLARAQTPASSPCDPLYYDSLESRAWLEAQREITQNQNLIFKPDSVLEYTCFDNFLNHLNGEEPSLFSSGNGWSSASNNANMQGNLQGLVYAALTSYLSGNFNHDYLGGQLTGVSYSPSGVNSSSYSCDEMKKVWETSAKTAKCRDFIADTAFDGFYTFAEYQSGNDRRHLPSACTNPSARWQQEMDIATLANTPWQEDPVITYLDRMDPANCGANSMIETGLTVVRNETPTGYAEKACVTPGCFFSGGSGGNCTANP